MRRRSENKQILELLVDVVHGTKALVSSQNARQIHKLVVDRRDGRVHLLLSQVVPPGTMLLASQARKRATQAEIGSEFDFGGVVSTLEMRKPKTSLRLLNFGMGATLG